MNEIVGVTLADCWVLRGVPISLIAFPGAFAGFPQAV